MNEFNIVWYKFSKQNRDEYLRSIEVAEDVISYLNELPDKEANPLLATINKNPKISLQELKVVHPRKEQSKYEKDQGLANILLMRFCQRNFFDNVFSTWFIKSLFKKHRLDQGWEWVKNVMDDNYPVSASNLHDFYTAKKQDNPRFDISNYSLEQIIAQSDDWHEAMAQKGTGKVYTKLKPENVIKIYENGYKLVELDNENDMIVEGNLMHHCIGGPIYVPKLYNKTSRFFSLRDQTNKPHVTIELSPDLNTVYQIQGFGDKVPKDEYKEMLREYFKNTNAVHIDSGTMQDQADDLRYAYASDYDDELMRILQRASGERDDFGLVGTDNENDNFNDLFHTVTAHMSYKDLEYYMDDIANTLATFAFKHDLKMLENLKNENRTITKKQFNDQSYLRNMKSTSWDVLGKFYENLEFYSDEPYPNPDDFDTEEEYEEALEKHENYEQEAQNDYTFRVLKNNPEEFWHYTLTEWYDHFESKSDYLKLLSEVVVDNLDSNNRDIQAFNLKKFKK